MPSESGHSAFVTGGTGFVGSHLVERLLSTGFNDVRCLVRRDPRFLEGLPIKAVHIDLSDVDALAAAVEDVDFVFHSAALTRARTWEEMIRANVDGTANLLEAVRIANPGVRKVLVTSSLAAVGQCESGVADENDPLRPISRYGRSKKLMEEAVAGYSESLPIVVVRPPAVYGPRESDIFVFFRSVSRGICPIVGSGRFEAVSLVHVRDLVDGMVQAALSADTTGETYFLGGPARYSWREVRDAAATALGRRVLTLPIPTMLVGPVGLVSEAAGWLTGSYPALNREKAMEIRSACKMCDHSKAEAAFGYDPQIDLWSGIRETIEWYRKEGWL